MAREWATVDIGEETMREGMQIEDKDIPVADKIRLLDALSRPASRTSTLARS